LVDTLWLQVVDGGLVLVGAARSARDVGTVAATIGVRARAAPGECGARRFPVRTVTLVLIQAAAAARLFRVPGGSFGGNLLALLAGRLRVAAPVDVARFRLELTLRAVFTNPRRILGEGFHPLAEPAW
jgi:hypothetical protein